jgi:hypothetical protein
MALILQNTSQVDKEKLEPIYQWLVNGGEDLKCVVGGKERHYDFCYLEWRTSRSSAEMYNIIPGHCGSVCCVGGAIEQYYRDQFKEIPSYADVGIFVGLDFAVTDNLFFPSRAGVVKEGREIDAYKLSATEVAKVLRKLMDENVLDWSIV